MTTIERPRSEPVPTVSPPQTSHRGRWLVGVVVVLAIAAFAAWVATSRGDSDTQVTDEVQQLLDDYNASWNNWDGDAFLELVTDDAVFVTSGQPIDATEQAAFIDRLGAYDWHVEPIGDAIMSGSGPWYVAEVDHLTGSAYPDEGYDGISTFTIVDVDGTLLVERHTYMGQF